MNLLTVIPEEVIEGKLLPYLKWNDLLRFRRVCRTSKDITDGFLRIHPELAPWIEINEDDKTFGAYLEMGIPTTKIFINNVLSGNELYEKDGKNISKFLQTYGPLVKHLRVGQISMFMHGKEWDFMEALVNLEEFQAECYGFGRIGDYSQEELELRAKETKLKAIMDPRYFEVEAPFPSIFKQLKAVKIGQNEQVRITSIVNQTRAFLQFSKMLERISMPFTTTWIHDSYAPMDRVLLQDQQQALFLTFMVIRGLIILRGREYPEKENLKIFDFINYHDLTDSEVRTLIPAGSQKFLDLCDVCVTYNVKLWNVDPRWFQARSLLNPELASPDLGIPVVSLVGLDHHVFPLNMPNLEKISIRAASTCNLGVAWRRQRPNWPALKHLEITVDSKEEMSLDTRFASLFPRLQTNLFHFFFQDVQRTALVELHLRFPNKDGKVAVPNTEEIVASCPNLKVLTLVNWPGTNKALTKLWTGLPNLEAISLELDHSTGLGNVAFVGEDVNDPVFLKLAKLHKLSLKGLDKMPKITDTLFNLVLRHVKLSHFIVTSSVPVTSVTSAGVLSLLQGKFADSIEKFPFQNWSLADVPPEEFKKMEAKFRSYNML